MEEPINWVVIIRGEAEGQEVRVALDFQDAESLLAPSTVVVGESFLNQLLELIRQNDEWAIKTVIEEVRTPQETPLTLDTPLFVILTKSHPRGLSAGALFITEDYELENSETQPTRAPYTKSSLLNTTTRFILVGLSPVGFAAACSEDKRLFTRFISRLLKRPHRFTEVSLLLPQKIRA
ncbi:MAG: hypothetical protein ACFE8O_04550 [Candidatus Hermodarchaeota archaeon]